MFIVAILSVSQVSAITAIPTPDPQPGSFGLEATKPQAPPKVGATVTTPANGASFTTSPTAVNGICPPGLLVQIFNNNVMVGSTMCTSGSFSADVSLFVGVNEITAIVYDDLDQAGPTSNLATINYSNTQFTAFGELITLTSSYGRRSATAGTELSWPLQLSGGSGPYAFSLDWGDGSSSDLKSQSAAGLVTIAHTYAKAGIYQPNVRVTDVNGVSAFLQMVAVASGQVDSGAGTNTASKSTTTTVILWVPAVVALVLLLPAYWLGRRSEVVSIRNRLLKDRDSYEEKSA